jgi:hypothetical protein
MCSLFCCLLAGISIFSSFMLWLHVALLFSILCPVSGVAEAAHPCSAGVNPVGWIVTAPCQVDVQGMGLSGSSHPTGQGLQMAQPGKGFGPG